MSPHDQAIKAAMLTYYEETMLDHMADLKRDAVPRLRKAGWLLDTPGADGLGRWRHRLRRMTLVHSIAVEEDGEVWAHVSVSQQSGGRPMMPSWGQLRDAFRCVYPNHVGIIVVPPESEHVNIGDVGHVWCCITTRATPDFTHGTGSI